MSDETKRKRRGIPNVGWDSLYRVLESLNVTIDEPQPGDPPDFPSLIRSFARVQNNRQRCERIQRKVDRYVAEAKRELRARREMHRIAELRAWNAPGARVQANVKAREVFVKVSVADQSLAIAHLEGVLVEWESASRAVSMQLASLEAAKQTLNAIRNIERIN